MDPKLSKTLYLIFGIVFLAILAWLVLKPQSQPKEGSVPNGTLVKETIMVEAVDEEPAPLYPPEELKQKIEDVLKNQEVASTILKDVSGGRGFGTAYRLYKDSVFYHKADARDLPALEKGFFYEGWLVDPSGAYFSTGRVLPTESGGLLYYQSDEDKNSYNKVVITLEPEDNDPAPAGHVLEGSF